MPGPDPYTLEDAERDIATLRGQADRTSEVITKNDSTDPPNTPAAGLIHYSTAGQHKYASSDGNYYATGCLRQQVSPRSQNINSTSALTIGGLSAAVAANATYLVHVHLVIEWNAAAGQPELRFAGPAVSQFDLTHEERQSGTPSITNGNPEALQGTGGAIGYNTGGVGGFYNPTVVMTAAGIFFIEDVWFWATFTAAGTLTLQAATTIAADPWIVFSGFWEVSPVI